MRQIVKTWSTPPVAENRAKVPCALCGGVDFVDALSCEGFAFVKCVGCGLYQQNPQSEAGDILKRYDASFGVDYLEYELANEASFLNLQKKTLEDAHFENETKRFVQEGLPLTFLDIGCATGALLQYVRGKGFEAHGLEISTDMAEYARKERALDVLSSTIEDAPFPPEHFTVIHASHLIEHLKDPLSFLRSAYKLLRKGGVLLLTTPNIAGWEAKRAGSAWRSAINDHLYLFSKKTLQESLTKTGFCVRQIITWGGIPKGNAPPFIKTIADSLAKKTGQGDVVFMKAQKPF